MGIVSLAAASNEGFHLSVTSAAWRALQQCWHPEVYLQPLAHRFWKLSLQIINRFSSWVSQIEKDVVSMVFCDKFDLSRHEINVKQACIFMTPRCPSITM